MNSLRNVVNAFGVAFCDLGHALQRAGVRGQGMLFLFFCFVNAYY